MNAVLYKAHGLGNDYIAVDPADLSFDLSPPAVRLLCDRNRGIGSDGVLALIPSEAASFGVRIFNPDGSEAEKSGNGLRIFAAYLLDLGRAEVGSPFTVETLSGTVEMRILRDFGDTLEVEVEMGRATFSSASVGLPGPDREVDGETLELESGDRVAISAVSMGNPHCVIFEDEVDEDDRRRRAAQISTHPWFERGTNVQFARAVPPAVVEAWVWERGAGETQASGSSACAVAAAAVRRGLVTEHDIEVRMPGGSLFVTVRDDWTILLRGPVEPVFRAEPTPGLLRRLEELG